MTFYIAYITIKTIEVDISRAISSAGRASVLQTEGRRFESCIAHHKMNTLKVIRFDSSVAQLVEHTTVNRKVAGSSPARGAKKNSGAIAQLVRASACHAEGREFESRWPRQKIWNKKIPHEKCGFFYA